MKRRNIFLPFYLAAIIIILFACSCNVTKNLHKDKQETKTYVITQTVTTKTVTEKADSVFVLKSDTVIGKSDDLLITPIIEFKDGLELIVTEDPKTKVITARAIKMPKKIHLSVSKITAINEVSHSKSETDFKNSTSDLHKEVTGGFNLNWIWLIIAFIIGLLFLAWRLKR